MRRLLFGLLAALVAVAGLLLPTPAGAAGEWQDGKSESDTIWDCWLNKPVTGVSANVGWWSPTGQVPKVGETFYVRGYAGLIGLPCSQSGVQVLPKLMLPAGVEFAPGAYKWDVQEKGEASDMRERPFTYDETADGGVLIGDENGLSFNLRQSWVLEFQFPVKATRELKGPATPAPECQTRRDGDGPCPIAQSGDHFQVGFTVTGHGGDKHYVTPYVPLFAAAASGPGTGPGTDPRTGPGTDPRTGPNPTKAASTTAAAYQVKKGRKVTATVTVSPTATGQVAVLDKGKQVATGTLSGGSARIRLPKLGKGKHQLVATYLGSAAVAGSSSPVRTVKVR